MPASSRTSAVRYSNCWVVVFFVEAEFRKRKEKVRVEVVVFFTSKIAEKRGPQASICFSRSPLSRSHARGCPIHPADATPECVRAHQKRPLVKREGSKERRRRFLEKIGRNSTTVFFLREKAQAPSARACPLGKPRFAAQGTLRVSRSVGLPWGGLEEEMRRSGARESGKKVATVSRGRVAEGAGKRARGGRRKTPPR